MPSAETDPLLSSNNTKNSDSSSYYFLSSSGTGTTDAVRDLDGGEVIESAPKFSDPDEFEPRKLGAHKKHPSEVMGKRNPPFANRNPSHSSNTGGSSSWNLFSRLFGKSSKQQQQQQQHSLVKLRKAPVKIEPKVFFANERTFLAWMHLSVILAGASIAILAFAEDQNPLAQLYGVVLLPVAVSFIVYSMYQYARRAKMIRNRHPGPYEDTVGPVVLGIMLMISITTQFALKMYAMHL